MASTANKTKIHIAKGQLKLTDDDYRATLFNLTGKESSTKITDRQAEKVLEHFKGLGWVPKRKGAACPRPDSGNQARKGNRKGLPLQKYESSKSGLLQELEDVARERWGDGFAKSLNAFVNANRDVQTHYKLMGVAGLKALKERIKEMNRKDRERSF